MSYFKTRSSSNEFIRLKEYTFNFIVDVPQGIFHNVIYFKGFNSRIEYKSESLLNIRINKNSSSNEL